MGAFFSRLRSRLSPTPTPTTTTQPPNPPSHDDVIDQLPPAVTSKTPTHGLRAPTRPINIPARPPPAPRLYSLSPEFGGPLSSYDQERIDRLYPDNPIWADATGK